VAVSAVIQTAEMATRAVRWAGAGCGV